MTKDAHTSGLALPGAAKRQQVLRVDRDVGSEADTGVRVGEGLGRASCGLTGLPPAGTVHSAASKDATFVHSHVCPHSRLSTVTRPLWMTRLGLGGATAENSPEREAWL